MLHMTRRLARPLAVCLMLALTAVACGDDDDGVTTDTTAVGGGALSGTILISGSSTVEPISALVAEDFSAENPGVSITVSGPGTGDGFEQFCAGETDISDASRAITEEEIANCEAAGIEFIELLVAIDGLSVITSQANDAVECLSFPDLYALVGPESEGFDNWSDANALGAEVGGSGDYPDAPLVITAPGEESGTYDSFVEIVLEGIAEERGQEADARPDYTASPNDNVIIDGVAGNDTSLGWVGFSFADANRDTVKLLDISEEAGGECIAPTPETIADNTYPISRPLFIYVSVDKLEASPALESFVDFYVSEEVLEPTVIEANYIPLDDDAAAETRSTWESRTTGTQQG